MGMMQGENGMVVPSGTYNMVADKLRSVKSNQLPEENLALKPRGRGSRAPSKPAYGARPSKRIFIGRNYSSQICTINDAVKDLSAPCGDSNGEGLHLGND